MSRVTQRFDCHILITVLISAFLLVPSLSLALHDSAEVEFPHPPAPPDVTYDRLLDSRYSLFPHRGTYFMPFSHNATPHDEIYAGLEAAAGKGESQYYEKTEAEFQISFMVPAHRKIAKSEWDLLVAYAHRAWWQAYNSAWSKPFRETNYMPEAFFRYLERGPKNSWAGFSAAGLDLGYAHESNGQIQALSRTWDRIFARLALVGAGTLVRFSFWYRLPESGKDDNPHILRYRGIGDLELRKSLGRHTLSVQFPLASKYMSARFTYTYPWRNHLRWIVSYEYGYGHSLIEYNRRVERVGVGLALESLLDNE